MLLNQNLLPILLSIGERNDMKLTDVSKYPLRNIYTIPMYTHYCCLVKIFSVKV